MSYLLKAFSKDGTHAVIVHDDGEPYIYSLGGTIITYKQHDNAPDDAGWVTSVDERLESIVEAQQYIRGFLAGGEDDD